MAVNRQCAERKQIPTLVKNSELVQARRRRIVDAAVGLFVKKGFHQTTTREIARAAECSIGSLYEYVSSKEDILYLVCDSIHEKIEQRLRDEISLQRTSGQTLTGAIARYFEVCDEMQDSILLVYQETASLDQESRGYVLKNEERITAIFEGILREGVAGDEFRFEGKGALSLMAHNIVVLGHMWAFRRWFLREHFTISEYTRRQTSLLLGELIRGISRENETADGRRAPNS